MSRKLRLLLGFITIIIYCSVIAGADGLEKGFVSPPDSARPWVYWFWLNGNITREGITADLEAMKRVGIGGVLIMEVDQGAPAGPVDFMSPKWRELFQHVVNEAHRLGLEVNMNDDAGWNGSGGPWIKPEQAMQKVVWSETEIEGPQRFDSALSQPQTIAGFYRDISVIAFPKTDSYRISNIGVKAAYHIGGVGPASEENVPSGGVIDRNRMVDLSPRMDASGRLVWDVPPGKWTIMRIGHTCTGAMNAPSPASGRGLECDKLSREGIEANFNGMMAKLTADVGLLAGKTLVATHIDSWENGDQNWTERMREEFRNRRGYDIQPYLPALSGRVVDSPEISERFLWDLRRTVSELVVENYAGHMRDLAHANGMKFTVEAYGSPCDSIPYAGQADEPMGEFWTPTGAMETCKSMASGGHVYGKSIIGAEAFTANSDERWRAYPGSIKALGDQAFCTGINRFVIHRYAMQPWVNEPKPGMSMGPWGLHYERTQTWWELTPAWHKYLSRCQFMLRQGLYAADVCFLQPEAPPQMLSGFNCDGYQWDECSAEVVMTRMSVRDGRIVLPDGMSYKLLVLPQSRIMTPQLLAKIRGLVYAGATVIGPRPVKSPSLSGYPGCDEEVKRLGDEVWGDCDGVNVKEHRFGKGRVICGLEPEEVLRQSGVSPNFKSDHPLLYIHRVVNGDDIYFVSNQKPYAVTATAAFRVTGKAPELWWPDSGRIEPAAVYEKGNGVTRVALRLEPSGSVFVIFRKKSSRVDPVVSIAHNGKQVLSTRPEPPAKISVRKAIYGILDDPARTRGVSDKVRQMVDAGRSSFQVAELARGDDPAFGVVKTAVIDYTIEGKQYTARGVDTETVDLMAPMDSVPLAAIVRRDKNDRLLLDSAQAGVYEITTAAGKKRSVSVGKSIPDVEIAGPWRVAFPLYWGAPKSIHLDRLISLSEHSDPGVKYFSGTATYSTAFNVPKSAVAKGQKLWLDLGDVRVIAQVKLNGRDLGVLWKPPYSIDVTGVVKPGRNILEVKVTNLWINRMIGDEQMSEDSDRNPGGTLKSWPLWLSDGKVNPTGRYTFTSWRLWRKGDALPESGLLGPVNVKISREMVL